ncbi:GntR family transcriptional regulator [Streptacidiphilus albus]|uniref:GntR family transcriptional regulator n=1 Tax=Streptacidiphilus albus TaxID=105425 RepID=UPI00054BAAD3|nr:GntR family transcriptional regulator [Streptacidiphilus albus]
MREQPPYLRVADALQQRITSGEWSPGDRLPSRAQLAHEFDVGDNVVRRAQELLITQGALEGRTGSGTYVAEVRPRLTMVRARSREERGGSPFKGDMASLGKHGSWDSRTEAKVPAPADIAARLGIAEGDLCVCTRYEFLADGKPVQLTTSWEPYDLTAGTIVVLPEGGPLAGAGVVDRMASIGITVSRAIEAPEPCHVTDEEAALLGVARGALATTIRRTYFSDDGRAVETADIVIPVALGEIVYEVPINL